jgi:pre-mRNA-splicing factor CDC5/CEF1
MTPASGGRGSYSGGRSVAATPLRDEFGLNRGDSSALVIADPRGDKVRQQQAAFAVRKGFMSLPAPEDKYDIVVPDVIPEDANLGMDIEEDAADRAERLARAEREALELDMKRRSQVVKRALPRPSVISGSPHCKDSLNPAELIAAELYCLMQHDATKFPLGDGRKVKNVFALPIDLSDDSLSAARALLDTEIQTIRRESEIKGELDDSDKWWKVWTTAYNGSIIYKDACVLASSLSTSEYVQYCKKEFEAIKDSMAKESSAASKLQKKTEIKTAGYVKKSFELDEKLMTANALNADLEIELACYRMLSKMEKEAIPSRMFKVSEEVEGQELREKTLQKRYELLLKQRHHLQSIIEQQ